MAAKASDASLKGETGLSSSAPAQHYFLGLTGGPGGMSKIATLMDLVQARSAADPLVKDRLRIERYLSTAPTTSQRQALIKRISHLAQGNSIQFSPNEQDDLQVSQA